MKPTMDHIYTYSMDIPIGTDLEYFFSYQNGANPETERNDEIVPD